MIDGLARFLVELRRAGLRVSPAEWLDGMRAVLDLGLDDRQRFRQALRCTLVKRRVHLQLFDRVFEDFFRAPALTGDRRGTGPRSIVGASGSGRGVAVSSSRSPAPRTAGESRTGQPRSEERRSTDRPGLQVRGEGVPASRGRLRRVVASSHGERAGQPPGVRRPELRAFREVRTSAEERELAREIPRWIERIRLCSARRFRRARRGEVNLRRLFRDNLRHDGVPWLLPRKRKRTRRARVVLLIDVSWSTARAAGLFLSMAGEFLRRARQTRVLLFVDRPVDATLPVEGWLWSREAAEPRTTTPGRRASPGAGIVRAAGSFADLLDRVPGLDLGAPSDYGRTFHRLLRSPHRPGGRNSVLVVLGDGRTNRFDPLGWCFEELAGRCGAVLWLVPESPGLWQSGDSALGDYLPWTDAAVEVSDLAGLARGVVELLRRLG